MRGSGCSPQKIRPRRNRLNRSLSCVHVRLVNLSSCSAEIGRNSTWKETLGATTRYDPMNTWESAAVAIFPRGCCSSMPQRIPLHSIRSHNQTSSLISCRLRLFLEGQRRVNAGSTPGQRRVKWFSGSLEESVRSCDRIHDILHLIVSCWLKESPKDPLLFLLLLLRSLLVESQGFWEYPHLETSINHELLEGSQRILSEYL